MSLKRWFSSIILLLLIAGMNVGCSSDDNSGVTRENLEVQVEPFTEMRKVPPFKSPEVEHLVLIIKSSKSMDYTVGIKGFDYEKGYTYILKVVRVTDKSLQDNNLWYELVEVKSKVKSN